MVTGIQWVSSVVAVGVLVVVVAFAPMRGSIVLFKYGLRIGGGVAHRRRMREVDGDFCLRGGSVEWVVGIFNRCIDRIRVCLGS